jgi:polysaccharide biosynthesis protein PslA
MELLLLRIINLSLASLIGRAKLVGHPPTEIARQDPDRGADVMDIASRSAVVPTEPTASNFGFAEERMARGSRADVGPFPGTLAVSSRLRLGRELVVLATAMTDFVLVLTATALNFAFSPVFSSALSQMPSLTRQYLPTAILSAAVFVAIVQRLGGYRPGRPQAIPRQAAQVALAWTVAVSVSLAVAVARGSTGDFCSGQAIAWFLMTPATLIAGRAIIHGATLRWSRKGALARNVVVVGAGVEGQKAVAKLLDDRDDGVVVLAVFDDRKGSLPPSVEGRPVLGTTDDLLRYARHQPIDQIVVALPPAAGEEIASILEKLRVLPADLQLSLDPLVEKFSGLAIGLLAGIPVLEIALRPLKRGAALCKWLEDKVIGGLLLIFLAPLLGIIAALIRFDSRGPIFFVQERFGLNNNVIRVLKFRTMYADRGDRSGAERTVRNDPRVTRVGRFLRQWSLDELPQLLNVLRGEMSLIGPRPHPLSMRAGDRLYHEAVPRYPHRHRVKPGLSGWAQVNGFRGEVDTLEKARRRVECDLYYIDNWSLWLDLRISLMTIGLLLSRANAY